MPKTRIEAIYEGDPAVVRHLSSEDLVRLVNVAESTRQVQGVLRAGFLAQAELKNDDPHAPFIVCEAINRVPSPWDPEQKGPAPWVAKAVGRIVEERYGGKVDVVIGIPRSATVLAEYIRQDGILPEASFPRVLKADQFRGQVDHTAFVPRPVSAYVRNRQADGSRGTEVMFFEFPYQCSDKRVLVLEDFIAEAGVTNNMARLLKEDFGASEVHVMGVGSKGLIQGGTRVLEESPYVDSTLELVQVHSVEGGVIRLAPAWHEQK